MQVLELSCLVLSSQDSTLRLPFVSVFFPPRFVCRVLLLLLSSNKKIIMIIAKTEKHHNNNIQSLQRTTSTRQEKDKSKREEKTGSKQQARPGKNRNKENKTQDQTAIHQEDNTRTYYHKTTPYNNTHAAPALNMLPIYQRIWRLAPCLRVGEQDKTRQSRLC